MTDDKRHDPHGPEQLPDVQPMPAAADAAAQPELKAGSASRWLVPAGALAAIAIVLWIIALQLQLLLPLIGIVYAVAMWVLMLVIARTTPDIRFRTRRLALAMGILAVGSLLIFIGIYVVETTSG